MSLYHSTATVHITSTCRPPEPTERPSTALGSGRWIKRVIQPETQTKSPPQTNTITHTPYGLQAALQCLKGDVVAPHPVDLVGQTEAHLQPVVDVNSNHPRCAKAANQAERDTGQPRNVTASVTQDGVLRSKGNVM